jgi:maleate cis-trans isomerase
MSAVRAKVGLVFPSAGTIPFWQAHAPEGVELLPAYLGYQVGDRKTFLHGFRRAEELALELRPAGCDIIAVGGTPPSLLAGLDFERQWGQDLSDKLGLPVVTPMESHALALSALGAERVAVATYYGDELNQAIVRYLARFDIEGVPMGGFRLTDQSDELYATPMQAQRDITEEQLYEYCRQGLERVGPPIDAIYVNGGGWVVTGSMIDRLERDFGADVIWGPVAEMWLVYWKLDIAHTAAGCGRLLRERHDPRPVRTG